MLREPGAGVHSHQQAQKKLKSQQNHQRPLKAWSKGTLQHNYDEEKEFQLWMSLDGDADEEEEEESAHQTEKLKSRESLQYC